VETFPERKRLSIHPLPPGMNKAMTWLIWRKGARSPKLSALAEILVPRKGQTAKRRANGR